MIAWKVSAVRAYDPTESVILEKLIEAAGIMTRILY